MSSWKPVYQTQVTYRAHMVKDLLEEQEIPALVVNKQNSPYLLGDLEVHVPPDYMLRAIHFINEEIAFE
ncbi:MAG TPA: hypothetical protein DCE41_03525 [Cytophagales bacterium]|nr:hypothetical protein [Cytophagales bacterium]HAA17711.1 hypothetical protein [Cytophagales bacterium]HAP60026.1 hypothetical protein [Cytophagales bacterium]